MTDSQHLVMLEEDGRSVMRRVSTAELVELKAVRAAASTPAIAPAAAVGPSNEAFVLNVPTVVESLWG